MRLGLSARIDRSRPVRFTFNGVPMQGFAGDTLASALLANDVRLVGRSFKYHRPRGVFGIGSEEPNALVTLGSGAAREPNVRATVAELHEGLTARSQNAWPSLNVDVLAVNDLLSPFLGAGFYYKTFMWPKSFWERVYEPVIRRAAGLGALSDAADGDHCEKAFAHCDVLVIGAGPTGLMAALTAARGGADVILADEDVLPGGRLNAEAGEVDGLPGHIWASELTEELAQMGNVRIMTRTTVTGAYDGGTFGALEKLPPARIAAGAPRECFWRLTAGRAILAAGATERPVAFANNDRPGVMLASAVRGYVNRFSVASGQRVVVFGNNDDAHSTARDLAEAGVHVAAVVDGRHDAEAPPGLPFFPGARIDNTSGRRGLESVSIRHADGSTDSIAADCLAVSGGWNPNLHLTCHMNGRPKWNAAIAAFVPKPGMVPGLDAAGAAKGDFSTHACITGGVAAGNVALEALGRAPQDIPAPAAEDAPTRIAPLWHVPGKGRAWLDLQNDVTVKDVTQAAAENFRSVEHMKRYTTQGMATDQGKTSNLLALAVLADATGRGIAETGTTTFRPPYTPVSIAAMGAGGQGKGFAPERLTTSHAATIDRGAPMIEAGLWYRPSFFPAPGETNWRQSCDREVRLVREAVGVCDVSTLGKIDIKGADAGRLLDLVYTNTFSTLKVGKVRYGLMLREDGHVLDDGTTARLADDHFVMTTTTAAAGLVMRHLEFVSQAFLPVADVSFTSVTEHWAQFAVAGPKARDLLNGVLDEDITDKTFPFMGCGPITVSGVAGRLFRISFSGEHAYELAVPARYGDSLFRLLVARAEAMDGGPYGMEALNVLRIEKGFITHAEIHGRVTAQDIGMGGMISAKKDCIGKTMAARPGLVEDRQELVGLRPLGAVKQLTAGAHLFPENADPVAAKDQGYVTSACFSPTLGESRALAFLKGGHDRHGERIKMVDGLRGLTAICEVTHPVAFDPDGGRARD